MPVLERPKPEAYSLIYPSGLPGEFISWLIQCHEGFPRIPDMDLRKDNPTGTDALGHQGRSWRPETFHCENRFGDKWTNEAHPFDDQIEAALRQGIGDFTKIVFKLNPYHYLNYALSRFDLIHTEDTNIKAHIVLDCDQEDLADMFAVCVGVRDDLPYQRSIAPDTWHLAQPLKFKDHYEEYVHYKMEFEAKGIAVHKIDVGQIFRQKPMEYYRLCDIIGSPPLPDWRKKVQIYSDMLFDGIQIPD
jgi:hypothetical protein